MKELFAQFFLYAATAALLENLVLSRGLGTSTVLFSANSARHIFQFGGLFTFMALISSLLGCVINPLIATLSFRVYIRPVLFILLLALLYYIVYFAVGKIMKSAADYVRSYLPYATFNCAMLGVLYLALNGGYNAVQAAGFSIGSGAGFTVASLLIAEGKRRLDTDRIPRTFRGLPIILLYIGLISLALFGLIGHQLPF